MRLPSIFVPLAKLFPTFPEVNFGKFEELFIGQLPLQQQHQINEGLVKQTVD